MKSKTIRKVVKNKDTVSKQKETGETYYPSEEILGTFAAVQDFARFNALHKEDLEVAKAHYLLDYCETQKFTPEMLGAYKLGLDCLAKLFESAEEDVKTYLKDTARKSKPVG